MVELVLTRYPDLKSVWDFGKVFNNPFRNRFRLFGRESSLDTIEHEMIRAKGVNDEPRIHMAVNCAPQRRGPGVGAPVERYRGRAPLPSRARSLRLSSDFHGT